MSDFVPRDEYEERHAALRERYEKFSRKTLRILKVLVVVLLLNGLLSAYLLSENSKRVDESTQFAQTLQTSIIESCETNGNPLREAARKFGHTLENQIREELQQSAAYERSGAYEKLFPSFDPDELHKLLEQNAERGQKKIEELEEAVDGIEAVDCAKIYEKDAGKEDTSRRSSPDPGSSATGAQTAFAMAVARSQPAASVDPLGPAPWLAPPPGSALLVP